MINRLHYEMIRLYSGDPKRIQHFCKVHSYAKLIAEMEHVDASTLFILEAAALTHDIGIHLCEEKYGSSNGKLQEKEGPAIAEKLLKELQFEENVIEECFQAVLSGSADCTYADNYSANYLLSQVKYRNLSSTTLTAMTEAASFGLSDQCDPRLLSIINKGLACISSEQLDSIVLQNCSYREDPSLFTLVYAYPRISIPIILAVSMALLSLLLGILLVHSRKTKEIRVMSETDALTGLYNRRAAEDHISRQMQEDGKNPDCVRPLISIDLDKFKQVNDTYGHLEGDALLIAVADTLRTSVRSYDIVGRIGGDEFVVYLSNVTDRQNAMAVAEKLCQVIRGLSTMKKEWSNISASIGISFADHPDIKMEELYISADKAMYSAKGNGRDQYQTL